jgi:hypothetical protein
MTPIRALGLALSCTAAAASAAHGQDVPDLDGVELRSVKVLIDDTQAELLDHDEVAARGGLVNPILFLNRCVGGCVIRPGWDSSINNTSTVVAETSTISQFSGSQANWDAIVACVRDTYAPFGIRIVTDDPGTVPHFEAIVAGTPQQAGLPCNQTEGCVYGVSPARSGGTCPVINNSITFSFANLFPSNINRVCWMVAQESAHSFGLFDHEALAGDAMTYIGLGDPNPPRKTFRNENGRCGEYQPNPQGCWCDRNDANGYSQNSYASLLAVLGDNTPTPPVVEITAPAHGATVEPGFVVIADVTDADGVAAVTLEIDGTVIATDTTAPYAFDTPTDLADGTHRVTVRAIDVPGATGQASIDVVIGAGCQTAADCRGLGEDYVCVGNRCVLGPGSPGGLGSACEDHAGCYSGRCEHDTEGNSYCVEACEPGGDDCPAGFRCLSAGVCWPSDGDGGGCRSATGRTPTLPLVVGAAVGALLIRRRRP